MKKTRRKSDKIMGNGENGNYFLGMGLYIRYPEALWIIVNFLMRRGVFPAAMIIGPEGVIPQVYYEPEGLCGIVCVEDSIFASLGSPKGIFVVRVKGADDAANLLGEELIAAGIEAVVDHHFKIDNLSGAALSLPSFDEGPENALGKVRTSNSILLFVEPTGIPLLVKFDENAFMKACLNVSVNT